MVVVLGKWGKQAEGIGEKMKNIRENKHNCEG
jgi:hypothetical protein